MRYNKPALTPHEIITQLKSRNLHFRDENYAMEQLKTIGYFRLANYLRPMEANKVNHTYKPNSYFENAVELYYFDKDLRALLFSMVQSFEISLRAKLINNFSLKYGPYWFCEFDLHKEGKVFTECLSKIYQEVSRSKEDFIKDYYNKYTEPDIPPVWKTLEVVSFGLLSKIFCNLLDKKLKRVISRELNIPQPLYLESWCKSAVALRNCLAHHARIWNRKFPIIPQMPRKLTGDWIDKKHVDSTKIYVHLSYLLYLMNSLNPKNRYKEFFKGLLKKYPNVDVTAMGFPSNWLSQPLWQ